jgi:hypothetical protein
VAKGGKWQHIVGDDDDEGDTHNTHTTQHDTHTTQHTHYTGKAQQGSKMIEEQALGMFVS